MAIGIYTWINNNPTPSQAIFTNTSSGLISNLSSPFGNGGTGKSNIIDTPISSINTTHSGAQPIELNLTWSGRTLSGVYYQFGSGNPVETDKSIEKLIQMNKDCGNLTDPKCHIDQLAPGELVSGNDNLGTWNPTSTPSRITPEIEYLVYSLLSNPIIHQSSESCGKYFFTYSQAYSIFGPGVGDTLDTNWWNPYQININDFIIVNPTTGRKELNLERVSTLNTQLQIPSELQGGQYYTNVPLRECLQKHNQLQLLQSHVASHYARLRQAWNGN
jgi:hypothetical protein